MKLKTLLFTVFLISTFSFSQEKDDLFNMIEQEEKKIELLPEKMIFTQSLLWGKKGLFEKQVFLLSI